MNNRPRYARSVDDATRCDAMRVHSSRGGDAQIRAIDAIRMRRARARAVHTRGTRHDLRVARSRP
jgi:hypothetical protein